MSDLIGRIAGILVVFMLAPSQANAGFLMGYMMGNSSGQSNGRSQCESEYRRQLKRAETKVNCYHTKLADENWKSKPEDIIMACENGEDK